MRVAVCIPLVARQSLGARNHQSFTFRLHAFPSLRQPKRSVHHGAPVNARPANMTAHPSAVDSANVASSANYDEWSNEKLIQRVLELEQKLRAKVSASSSIVGSNNSNESNSHAQHETSSTTMATQSFHSRTVPIHAKDLTAQPATTSLLQPETSTPSLSQEASLQDQTIPLQLPKAKKARKSYNSSKWTRRHIALKFAYLGGNYNGFEHHANNKTPLPTVEEELWRALVRTRLIAPPSLARFGLDGGDIGQGLDKFGVGEVPVDWEGCRYSKCGRTDRGVSAFGQVIGVLVRSARKQRRKTPIEAPPGTVQTGAAGLESAQAPLATATEEKQELDSQSGSEWEVDEDDGFDSIKDEINYVSLLNRVLPPTIRMLAWCPNAPANFDARFSCKEREYRYFFTQPAYLPIPGSEATLDIDAMREAAQYLIGSHDFRNMCKIDPAKQITEFIRKVRTATVEKVDTFESPRYVATARDPAAPGPKMAEAYCIRVSGTAFLWHQVRCIVGVLFLVGQGYEKPDIVKQLLDVPNCPARPAYEMADDRPLVLWDCRFSATAGRLGPDDVLDRPLHERGEGADELEWVYPGSAFKNQSHTLGGKWNKTGVMESLWKIWRATKMDEILAAQLFDVVALADTNVDELAVRARQKSVQIFQGEDTSMSKGTYVPVMQKKRLNDVDAANAQWLSRKGPDHRRVRRMFGQVPKSAQPLDS